MLGVGRVVRFWGKKQQQFIWKWPLIMASINAQDSPRKLRSPAAERNKEPILHVLKKLFATRSDLSKVLEIASGTGQHVSFFASHFKNITWQPTECDSNSLASIQSYRSGYTNIVEPVNLDTREEVTRWGEGKLQKEFYDCALCVNMIHISEWESTQGLFKGSSEYLKPGGLLICYGPFKMQGKISPQSNVQFDQMLRLQNSEWGLRDTDDLENLAKLHGMKFSEMFDMPANNKILVYEKCG